MLPTTELRLSWFPVEPTATDMNIMFHALFNDDPERSMSSKSVTQQNPYLASLSSRINGYNAELNKQPGRIDLLIRPADNNGQYKNLATIDTETAHKFIRSVISNAKYLPPAQRLSFINVCALENDSLAGAQATWRDYIGCDLDFPESSDHFLQINSRKTITNTSCNRVIQASVLVMQNIQLTMAAAPPKQEILNSFFITQITHDFNTVPLGHVFDQKEQKTIFPGLSDEIIKAATIENISFLKDQ